MSGFVTKFSGDKLEKYPSRHPAGYRLLEKSLTHFI